MKKYTQLFTSTCFFNLIFWAILFGIYYFINRNYLIWGLVFVFSIAIITALLDTIIEYFKKRKNNLIHLFKGVLGIIYLVLTSGALVLTIRNTMVKKPILIALYLFFTIIFFNLFKKLFTKTKK